ncbi:MAG TPA: YggU family protein [Candidatus Omnitrophica bacterium]|nr:YggU family protein [Candidatus Omnitrophota bacterium]
MIVSVRIRPNAKKNIIVKEVDNLKVYLTAPAVEGKANKALVKILAGYFDVAKSQINIVKGKKSREKLVEIL